MIEASDACAEVSRLAEVTRDGELRHAETLLPAIDQCLERAGCSLNQVDGLSVSLGPGSFTGLRVGLATAKGLVLATGAWLVGISTLEAYARAAARRAQSEPGRGLVDGDLVYVCLDARKGEVYSALFVAEGAPDRLAVRRVVADAVELPAQALSRLASGLDSVGAHAATLCVAGDGAERYGEEILGGARRYVQVGRSLDGPAERGFTVAELGVECFQRDGAADPVYLAPAYLRQSEAERNREAAAREARLLR